MRSTKPVIVQSKPETRLYSVLPARAIQDDFLHATTLRVLGAICLHTNKYGICFPSRITLGRHVSRTPKTVSFHVSRLIKLGYIRKLQKRDYRLKGKPRKSKYATNRYQVLYEGKKTKLPSMEQFYAPRPKVAEEFPEDKQPVTHKSRDLKGLAQRKNLIYSIAQAFCTGIEQASSVHKIPDNYLIDAEYLYDKGILPQQILESTVALTIKMLKDEGKIPLTIKEVAKKSGLY